MKKLQNALDKGSTVIAAVMCAVMMVILFANVVLRLIPGIGGFKWYMEGGQYINVWSMLIVGICITAKGTHLHVELVDAVAAKNPILKKLHKVITSIFIFLFYVMVTYSGWQLSTRAKQAVSTMPQFKMGQVYVIFVIAGAICALSALVDMVVAMTEKEEGGAAK